MNFNQNPSGIPLSFKPYLWSSDFMKLDKEKNKQQIILSILYFGDVSDWDKLFAMYGMESVKEIFEKSKPDLWHMRSYNFWKFKFS